jgi:hypothetical protein
MKTTQLKTQWYFSMLAAGVVALCSRPCASNAAAELQLRLPLNRTAYACNEWIDITAVRGGTSSLPAGELVLKLIGTDGSELTFVFPVDKAEASEGAARAVEHLHVNGWLLRPGPYTVEAACDGATARTNIAVFTHLRRSSFKLVNWGRATGKDQLPQGE